MASVSAGDAVVSGGSAAEDCGGDGVVVGSPAVRSAGPSFSDDTTLTAARNPCWSGAGSAPAAPAPLTPTHAKPAPKAHLPVKESPEIDVNNAMVGYRPIWNQSCNTSGSTP